MATTNRLLYISDDGLVRQLGFDPTAADLGGAAGVASSTHAATSKTTPVDADEIPMSDSAASWGLKKLTWANLKATAKTYFDTLYQAVGTYVTPTTLNNGTLPASVTTLNTGGNITSGAALTVRSPDGVEGGQITLNNRANTVGSYNFDVDTGDHGRLFTAQNNTNLSIGQLAGTGGAVKLFTGGVERARIDASGAIIVGATATYTGAYGGPANAQFSNAGYAVALGAFSVTDVSARLDFIKSRNTAIGSHTIVANNDDLGQITFCGSDGASFLPAALIKSESDGTPGTNDMPGRLVFSTTADGAASPTERMRIDSSGRVGIGTPTPRYQFHVEQESGQYALIRGKAGSYGTLFGSSDTPPIASNNGFVGYTGVEIVPNRWGSAGGNADYHNVLYIGGGQRNVGATSGSIAFANWGYFTGTGTAAGELGNATAQGDSVSFNIAHRDGGSQFNQTLAVTGRTASGTQSDLLTISTSGEILARYPAGLGYGAGAGGTVTQATSKSTAVTLNKPTGRVTTTADALAAGATATFLVNNSLMTTSDSVVLATQAGGVSGANYNYWVAAIVAGGFYVSLKNISAGSLSEAVAINFSVIKGATS